MPFERYLSSEQEQKQNQHHQQQVQYDSSPLQFQLPACLFNGPPALAQGGGAEVLPLAVFGPPGSASSWFANNGFSPQQSFKNSAVYQDISYHKYTPLVDAYASQYLFTPPSSNIPPPPTPLARPPLCNLPVYSYSGFDLMSILSRVVNRPHPAIILGPVDMTCSFTVVDVRRYDNPIVYASPTFCRLTGYAEHEVLGRNCRFLQAPDGSVQRGDFRRCTAPEAVAHLKKSLVADKECQTSILNYRKDGTAFMNIVTVIPIPGGENDSAEEADEVVYHVGFQVDLNEQPNAILQKLADGNCIVNYSSSNLGLPPSISVPSARERKLSAFNLDAISQHLCDLLADPAFFRSMPLSIPTGPTLFTNSSDRADSYDGNQPLSFLLLQNSPDFVLVVSLKGLFQYVGPSVYNVLGYESNELVGKSITDYAHQADVVPLMRELKESSTILPRAVDLLFRMKSKDHGFVWLECRGRLYSEPGKGRKAIILSGRTRADSTLAWGIISCPSNVIIPSQAHYPADDPPPVEMEFCGMVSSNGLFLSAGAGAHGLLGWTVDDLIGMSMSDLVIDNGESLRLLEEIFIHRLVDGGEPVVLSCTMSRNDARPVDVHVSFFLSHGSPSSMASPPILYRIRSALALASASSSHPPLANVFEELSTDRSSSWQYELQQLKFANNRLREDVDALETALLPCQVPAQRRHSMFPKMPSVRSREEWGLAMTVLPASSSGQLLQKRSWDVANEREVA